MLIWNIPTALATPDCILQTGNTILKRFYSSLKPRGIHLTLGVEILVGSINEIDTTNRVWTSNISIEFFEIVFSSTIPFGKHLKLFRAAPSLVYRLLIIRKRLYKKKVRFSIYIQIGRYLIARRAKKFINDIRNESNLKNKTIQLIKNSVFTVRMYNTVHIVNVFI